MMKILVFIVLKTNSNMYGNSNYLSVVASLAFTVIYLSCINHVRKLFKGKVL